jgi:hypothetical protein
MQEQIDFEKQQENFDPANFPNPTKIDNRWFPLNPGTQFVWHGATEETPGQLTAHRLVFSVTDLTKVINGVRSVVISAQDYAAGELVETELSFFLQDDAGNVWHNGEYPEEYDQGKFEKAPAWVAGVDGARPGITIKKEPQLGGPSYSQGWSPTVPWTDRARISEVGLHNCVPAACYDNVIVAEEFSREEPAAFQLKYYAPGVGNIRTGFRGQDALRENLELISVTQLAPDALAEVRTQALALDTRAYTRAKKAYGQTPRAEHTPPGTA